MATSSDSDENYNKSSSPDLALDLHASDVEADVDGDEAGDADEDGDADADGDGSESSNNCSEEEDNGWGDDEIDNVDVMDGEEESSSSGDDFDLPIDDAGQDPAALAVHVHHSHTHSHSHSHNDSGSSRNSSSGGGGRSDNTTHSYSSLLLEEEDDIVPVSLNFGLKENTAADLDVSNGICVINQYFRTLTSLIPSFQATKYPPPPAATQNPRQNRSPNAWRPSCALSAAYPVVGQMRPTKTIYVYTRIYSIPKLCRNSFGVDSADDLLTECCLISCPLHRGIYIFLYNYLYKHTPPFARLVFPLVRSLYEPRNRP